jgi:Cytochrome P460
MQKYLLAMIVGLGLAASAVYYAVAKPVAAHALASLNAAPTEQSSAVFNADGTVQVPTGFRKWVFVGAPLTPEGLNNGKYNCNAEGKNCTRSNFPEYHHVYIEQKNVDAYLKTGDFPEGTVIVKELTRVLNPEFPDSSRKEPSGRGYFNGAYNGIDMSIKDSKRFAKTNGWGFFTFGHHPMPYEKTAAEKPAAECAGCHIANAASTDMTYIQFYPLLRDKPGY